MGYGTAAKVCKAAFLGKSTETPVFVRFSTVVGSRGSADAVRDTRGFGRTWPVDGRIIGIVVDPAQLAGVHQLRDAIFTGGMVPLLIAPHGGTLDGEFQAQRTFLTARSVEFDALLLSARPPPAPDARPSRDAKAGIPDDESTVDPRVVMMVQECFRHAKAIGAWGSGTAALEVSGYGQGNPGVVVDDDPDDVLKQIMTLLSTYKGMGAFPTRGLLSARRLLLT